MWIVVQIIQGINKATQIEEILSGEGIFVKTRPIYRNMAENENYYEILVLKSEVLEARELLMEKGY